MIGLIWVGPIRDDGFSQEVPLNKSGTTGGELKLIRGHAFEHECGMFSARIVEAVYVVEAGGSRVPRLSSYPIQQWLARPVNRCLFQRVEPTNEAYHAHNNERLNRGLMV
jgi:hypothetical protein